MDGNLSAETTYGLIGTGFLEQCPAIRYRVLVGGFGEACQASGDDSEG